MTTPAKGTLWRLLAPLIAVGLTACGTAVSTTNFKGEEHEVAQAISNLQADVRENSQQKACTEGLARALVNSFGGAAHCETALKGQLSEVDSFELTVESVHVDTKSKPPTATATVKSIYGGRNQLKTLSLVKEEGKWKLSRLQ
jgi:hypothetical protein